MDKDIIRKTLLEEKQLTKIYGGKLSKEQKKHLETAGKVIGGIIATVTVINVLILINSSITKSYRNKKRQDIINDFVRDQMNPAPLGQDVDEDAHINPEELEAAQRDDRI